MKAPIEVTEKIWRIWSSHKQDDIAVRLRYTVTEQNGCRVFSITSREEWD